MALRVLLADESSTIKKVFQLALQDYAVDVRPVNVGIDVLPVARSFKPDIIFADVLLQKQSGYDVAANLKQDPDLGTVPVVLMWSGFMEFDEDKFTASRAEAKLEKPFDVNQLRGLVNELVPKTKGNRLSQYLSFPSQPEFKEDTPERPDQSLSSTPTAHVAREDFEQVPLPKIKGKDKYRVDISATDDQNDIPVAYQVPSEKIEVDSLLSSEDEPEEFAIRAASRNNTASGEAVDIGLKTGFSEIEANPKISAPKRASSSEPASTTPLSPEDLEKIIRQQSREVIEAIVWRVVPDLAAQIIEREIARLLQEREGVNPF